MSARRALPEAPAHSLRWVKRPPFLGGERYDRNFTSRDPTVCLLPSEDFSLLTEGRLRLGPLVLHSFAST